MTMTPDTRCLGHDCANPDQCLRHVVIQQRTPPKDDTPVFNNACRWSPYAPVPINPLPSFNENEARREALE